MKITLSKHEAAEMLAADVNAMWTRAGALALIEYFEALNVACGKAIELDRISLRHEYTEYKSALECADDYDYDGEQSEQAAAGWLGERTTVLPFEGGVVIQLF